MTVPKKAFISHASEDKERFVTAFAKRLRENGVDAWYDEWEIQPGDSIVEKIFEQGIKSADAFVVVLSRHSVGKPWVREELDAGIVRKIQKTCRVIPVVLDDCDVPVSLAHLRWEKIGDLNDYDAEFQRIVNVIFGGSERPPLGTPPAGAGEPVVAYVPGLTKTDNLVFRILGEHCLKTGLGGVDLSLLSGEFVRHGLSGTEVAEALEILEGRFYLDPGNSVRAFNPATGESDFKHVFLTAAALAAYSRMSVPGYERMVLDVVSGIVNRGFRERKDFGALDSVPTEVLEVIVTDLERQGLIDLLIGSCGLFHQLEPKGPGLKRMLDA